MLITDVECLYKAENIIGEGPVWNDQEQALYWLDAPNRIIQRWTPKTRAVKIFKTTKMLGSIAFRRNAPGVIVACRNALAFMDYENGREEFINVSPPLDFAKERFNDGAADRAGRFWTGTLDREGKNPVGSLYRIDPDLTITRMETGIIGSNGIAWSPDNKTMYYTDSRVGVYAYDFDLATGSMANRRLHITVAKPGHADGCTIDAEGFLWVVESGTPWVRRYDPKGKIEREIRMPVERPTSCMFGGEDLSTLFITSLRIHHTPEQLVNLPMAGALFQAHPGVKGLPEPRFAG